MDNKLKQIFRIVKEPDGRFHGYHRPTNLVIIICSTRQDTEDAITAIYHVASNPDDWPRADLGRGFYPTWLKMGKEVRNAWIVSNGDTPPGREGKRVAGYG